MKWGWRLETQRFTTNPTAGSVSTGRFDMRHVIPRRPVAVTHAIAWAPALLAARGRLCQCLRCRDFGILVAHVSDPLSVDGPRGHRHRWAQP
jgi:hypothetical protein